MQRTSINADDAPKTPGTYVQAIHTSQVSELLHISGQIPVAVDGTVPGTFRAQADLVWQNIDAQLRAAGMSKQDLVKATVYLSSRDHIADYRAARDAYLAGHEIALTVIVAGIFDEAWLLEIEAVAAR